MKYTFLLAFYKSQNLLYYQMEDNLLRNKAYVAPHNN